MWQRNLKKFKSTKKTDKSSKSLSPEHEGSNESCQNTPLSCTNLLQYVAKRVFIFSNSVLFKLAFTVSSSNIQENVF